MREIKIVNLRNGGFSAESRMIMKENINRLCEMVEGAEKGALGMFMMVDSEAMDELAAAAEELGIQYEVTGYKMKYTPSELKNAKYFRMMIASGRSEWTADYGTEYDEIICPKCGKIRERVKKSRLMINKSKFRGKDISVTGNGEIIISEKLKNIFESNNITGVQYEIAEHWNDRLKNDYPVYYMVIESTMPPIDESVTYRYDVAEYCDKCRSRGITPTTYYRYKNIGDIADINNTYEIFYYTLTPQVIVSKRVYDIIKENDIRTPKFEIVEFI